ncbi:MAG: hypothetical protein OZ948_07760 [Deltaproteobacteria bacterium]|nr:hypothetical protein [Deltaproteobacteria bacterium]
MIRRIVAAADAVEARLGTWPVACALLLGLLVLLGTALLAGP